MRGAVMYGPGVDDYGWPAPMGHEYAGIVEEVGDEVTTIRPGQFVVGSFFASDNTCELFRAGYQSSCVNREAVGAGGAQAELLRVPLADGTFVATPEPPPDELIPSHESMMQAIGSTRPGEELFYSHVHLHRRPCAVSSPTARPDLERRAIDPEKIFDLELPLEEPLRRTRGRGEEPRPLGHRRADGVLSSLAANAWDCRRIPGRRLEARRP